MAFGKSEQERLTAAFDYLKAMKVAQSKIDLLFNWVYVDGPFSSASVSEAMSLGFNVFNRHGTTKDTRHAIRALILARLAIETPTLPTLSSTASGWKTTYQSQTETQLQVLINGFMNRLVPAVVVTPIAPKNVTPQSYGVSQSDLASAIGGLKAPKPKIAGTIPPSLPGASASVQDKKQFFETTSRLHVIFSGHGSWIMEAGSTPWPFINLGPQQIMRYYCDHYYPLGNDAGQLVDNRRFPAAKEVRGPGGQIWDYTLQEREKLVLLNKGGGNADQDFVTVKANTKLSSLINDPRYGAATFHWAACRVVFSDAGELFCPTHNTWEAFVGACVLR